MVFEFTAAALMFFGIMFFIITYMNQSVRSFSSDAYREVLQSKAFQISDMLIKSQGVWTGDPGVPIVVGMAAEWPMLNATKMEWMRVFCTKPDGSGYETLKRVLGLKEKLYDFDTGEKRNFNITVTDVRLGSILLNCGKDPAGMRRTYIRRVAVTENANLATVDVSVW